MCDDAGSASLLQVGAPSLEASLRKFHDIYRKGSGGTEGGSRLTILALLYDFHLVQSLRISYMLEKLTGTFTEKDKELILFRLRNGVFIEKTRCYVPGNDQRDQGKASGAGSTFRDQTRDGGSLDLPPKCLSAQMLSSR